MYILSKCNEICFEYGRYVMAIFFCAVLFVWNISYLEVKNWKDKKERKEEKKTTMQTPNCYKLKSYLGDILMILTGLFLLFDVVCVLHLLKLHLPAFLGWHAFR